MTSLIISADDYAQSAAIDTGILNLIRLGRVTAVSCLTLSPRWQDSAKLITPEIRELADIGLHLDFTLYPQPPRNSLPKLILQALCRQLPEAQLRLSIQRQLDAFENALGTAPDYIDGHQHVHQLPQIRDILAEEISLRYKKLPWIRIAKPGFSDGLKAMVIGFLGANQLMRMANRLSIPNTQSLLGVYNFNLSAKSYDKKLNEWLEIARYTDKPTALMCHPAFDVFHPENAEDPIFLARLAEYQVFANDQFLEALQQRSIRLSRGTSVLKV